MSVRSLPLQQLADMAVWRALQVRIAEVTALRFGLWDEDAQRVLAPAMLPPACQYVLSEPDRRERCEQFHGSVRADVRRRRKATCSTCPFGVQYMAVPIAGRGLLAGHWEGGYVVEPAPPAAPDASLDAPTWFAALAVTPHRTHQEIKSALALIELLHEPLLAAVANRERRRDQVALLVGYELNRVLDVSRSPADALARFVHLVAQVLGAPVVTLTLRDAVTGKLSPAAAELPGDADPREHPPACVAVSELVARDGVRVAIADLRDRPDLVPAPPADAIPAHKTRTVVGVPVQGDAGLVAVLAVSSLAPGAFDEDDIGLLARLAELVPGVLSSPPAVDLAL